MAEQMQGTVRIAQVEAFHTYAGGLGEVRRTLGDIGAKPHTVLTPPPAGAFPDAGATAELEILMRANELAFTRLADYTTRADRGLAGLAFVSTFIGTRYPETDRVSAEQIEALVQKGRDAVPPVPDVLPGIDPRFRSARKA